MAQQKHKHRPASSVESCWSYCITPDECANRPERQKAHGWVHRIDKCRCGALRHVEVNFTRSNYGPWIMPGTKGGNGVF